MEEKKNDLKEEEEVAQDNDLKEITNDQLKNLHKKKLLELRAQQIQVNQISQDLRLLPALSEKMRDLIFEIGRIKKSITGLERLGKHKNALMAELELLLREMDSRGQKSGDDQLISESKKAIRGMQRLLRH